MTPDNTYKAWKAVTEADFVSLFIKTWFAYISTLRTMFPEAYNRRGDKKYLDAYKKFYRETGYKKFVIDDNIMASIETVYHEGRNVIIKKYPEYYLWDFYNINEDFNFIFKQLPPDKSKGLVIGLKMNRNRGTKWSFIITCFVKVFGKYYGKDYHENLHFNKNISSILNSSAGYVASHPCVSEQDYLAWILQEVNDTIYHEITEQFKIISEKGVYGKRVLSKLHNLEKQTISAVRSVFTLNAKDESFKTKEDMQRDRNSYEVIRQRPLNYFLYHGDVSWRPSRRMTSIEEEWYKELTDSLKTKSVLWFLDFVYRLRNALFHEIIDPLDEEWQTIFKNSYLILKELVDLNINHIHTTSESVS